MLVTCVCPERCEIHPVNRGRRFFLMGALALPVAAKLELPAALVPGFTVFKASYVYTVQFRDGGTESILVRDGVVVSRVVSGPPSAQYGQWFLSK